MIKILSTLALAAALITACNCEKSVAERWSEEKANAWYAERDWPVGCDYVPAYAGNQIQMWQSSTWDPAEIDKELGWAEELGFNSVRIFLHDKVWSADRDAFFAHIEEFLKIADSHGISSLVTLFTNGGSRDRCVDEDIAPIPGIHNSIWAQTPGIETVNDPSQWDWVKEYEQDVLRHFKDDSRIIAWCLYNEPENFKQGARSLPLLREVFKWGREANPSQPLSSPLWICPGVHGTRSNFPIISFLGENCDIMTFHCYYGPEEMETFISLMKQFGRPMVCQEYMGRPRSTFEEIMPILKRERVGAISWGLTAGKCNFHLQWSSKAGDPEPEVWFHDIFRLDGTPYSQQEVDFIRSMTQDKTMN